LGEDFLFFSFFFLKNELTEKRYIKTILKLKTMPNFIVKTHKPNTKYNANHFFVLNKSTNSGQPQKEPFMDCFVILFSNEEEEEKVYCIAYSLWKTKFWHPYLKGSVIPFLEIADFENHFSPKVNEMLLDFENHQKDVKALQLLELKEEQCHQNRHLINDLRRLIIHRYCKK
jgi:hypothetical protein